VARELRRRILLAFREAGIQIPYSQRVVHHRGIPDRDQSADS
jgi:small-conductance mechanosensitive channel